MLYIPPGARSVFLFEKDVNEMVKGATVSGEIKVDINLDIVKISASASFSSINNETSKDNTLKVKFHGDFLISKQNWHELTGRGRIID